MTRRAKWWLWPAGLIVAFLCLVLLIGTSPEGREKRAARDLIDRCWDEQKRKSYTPQAARTMAGICETYESQFVGKYGYPP